MIFEKKMTKQSIARHWREANILTFIKEHIDIRNYKWEALMLIHIITYAKICPCPFSGLGR